MSNPSWLEKFSDPTAVTLILTALGGGAGFFLNWLLTYKKQETESRNSQFTQDSEITKYRDSYLREVQKDLEATAAANRAFFEKRCKEQEGEIQDLESRLEKLSRENSEIIGKMAAIELQNIQIEERRNAAFDRLRLENERLRNANHRLAAENIKLQQRISPTGTPADPPPKTGQ